MAIDRRAPEYLILAILKANPAAASVPNKNEKLPLHFAAEQNLSAGVIVQLIKAFPEALDTLDANRNTPRDHQQKDDLSKEALMRPTACWIEETEKEQYYIKVTERREELRQKMSQLKDAVDSSNHRIEVASNMMSELEPRIDKIDCAISKSEDYRSQLANMKGIMCNHLNKVKLRLSKLEESTSKNNKTEVNMMNSILKREYVEGVKSSYEHIMKMHQEMKKDLIQMKSLVEKRNPPGKTLGMGIHVPMA